jgi:hypothetical protein
VKQISCSLILIIVLTLTPSSGSGAPSPAITVLVDGQAVPTTSELSKASLPPILAGGHLMLPIAWIHERWGKSVWIDSLHDVIDIEGDIHFRLGQKQASIWATHLGVRGTQLIPLPLPPQKIGGRIYVPARPFADTFGYDLHWDAAARVVQLRRRG